MNAGIYIIVNTVNGKRYVGSAAHFGKRWGTHKARLRRAKHHSRVLQRAWSKYGEAAFVFRKLLLCKPEHLLMYEQLCLDRLKPEYNCCLTAGSPLGRKWSAETRVKTIAARVGLKRGRYTPEHCAKISASLRGRKLSSEHRAKVSAAFRGRLFSTETRQKLSAAAIARWAVVPLEERIAYVQPAAAARRGSP